ncbi:efflux RND transporter periplasmic adaptor subunit [Phenylobacterium sp.]|uniref:efflux RND transporter periplasmic adaptor subunit n=1 Tax=Phenylobacterium sp. TaxID=1871053 RepID=UPI0035B38595
MTRSKTAIALALMLAAVSLSACDKPKAKETEAQRARAVSVVRIQAKPIAGALAASGSLIPREEAAVLPEVSGYRVDKVLVDAGAWVKAGQPLAVLDGALLAAQVEQQRAAAAQADVQARQAESQAARVDGLDGQGVLSEEQLEARRFQAKAARATAEAQAAALKDAETRQMKLKVTAPVTGLVLSRSVRPGDMSAVGATTPWFRIAEDGQIELEAEMTEEDLSRVRVGETATVTLPSGATAQGRVRLVSPQVDAQTKLGTVRLTLPVRSDIRAGGFGRAVFDDVSAQGLTVPETAVRYDADGASVMVVGADNRVRRVHVETGARGGGMVVLTKGPAAGSRVVKSAGSFLLDGDLVRPQDEPAAPAKASAK